MGLPQLLKPKATSGNRYLCLLLSDHHLQTALWEVAQGQTNLIKNSSLKSYQTPDQAVVETDKALQDLGKASENVDEVVLGVPATWLDGQDLVAAKKPLLKKITEDLSLNPLGFVIFSEAVAHDLIRVNPRLSTLIIEFSQHDLILTLVDQGKLVDTKFVGRSDNTIADMAEALARLNAHHEEAVRFPAKMLLISLELIQEELAEQQQLLLEQDWVNSHPFSQPPTVDVLAASVILDAVVVQSGVQLGGKAPAATPEQLLPAVEPAELAIDPDIANVTPAEVPSSFGIPIPPQQLPVETPTDKIAPYDEDEVKSDQPKAEDDEMELTPPSSSQSKFKAWFAQHRIYALGGFGGGILALFLISWIWLAQTTQAMIKLDLETVMVSSETNLRLDAQRQVSDVERLILAADLVTTQVSKEQQKETTGTKVVGDKASGEITIFNKTQSSKVFEAGISFSKGDLVFTLDEEVEVASASVKTTTSGESKEYGQVQAQVTARQIGADSNLSSGEELQVATFDPGTYSAAVAEKGLSGGSSREVRVVSTEDRQALLSELTQTLIDQANEELKADLEEGEYLVPGDKAKVISSEFSAEVDEEVSTLSLNLKLEIKAQSYQVKDLEPIAEAVLSPQLPAGYTLTGSQPQILSAPSDKTASSGAVLLTVNISAQAQPEIEQTQLKESVSGLKLPAAIEKINALEHVRGVEIELKPKIAHHLRSRLPKKIDKIELL